MVQTAASGREVEPDVLSPAEMRQRERRRIALKERIDRMSALVRECSPNSSAVIGVYRAIFGGFAS